MTLLLACCLALSAQDAQLTGLARTKELAEQGDTAAIAKLAAHYSSRNLYRSAYDLYLPFAEAGDDKVQYTIGSWLLRGQHAASGPGQSIGQDIKKGLEWINLSAHQGNHHAMRTLGDCYKLGRGVKKDPIEAYKWFVLALNHGDGIRTEKEQLETWLKLEDIREGQRRADAFQKKDAVTLTTPSAKTATMRPDFLKLALISGSSKEPVAMINGTRFTPGLTATLTKDGQPVQVQCVEITRDSAFVTFPPATQRFQLRL